MSVVIAIKKNDRIYMAADSQTSCGDRKTTYYGEGSRKICRFDNGIILGHTGAVHNTQIVCAHSEVFTVPEDGNMTKKYIVQNIIPKLFKLYREGDMREKEDGIPSRMGESYLLAYKDKLFVIDGVFDVEVHEHFAEIGSGGDLTHAGLIELDADGIQDEKAIEERLTDLLRISASRTMSVSGPYYIINTADCKFKMVE
jgi:ATP-dependent protease HslVU (ClpYQ) peptidase subunit